MDSFITGKTVNVINSILERGCSLVVGGELCPVNYAQLHYRDGYVQLEAVLARPLFRGWRTETPFISYQFCPLSVTVPPKPDDNHIPEFVYVLDTRFDLTCWESVDNTVVLWTRSGDSKIVFVKGGN
jgi:hypothetical protein